MTQGSLVRVHHLAPGPRFGVEPTGGVLGTVGRVGVVLRATIPDEPGRVEVLFPDGKRYIYAVKCLEAVHGPKGPVTLRGWEGLA
jgi:hypothetical protein